jgi:hypothetical protein
MLAMQCFQHANNLACAFQSNIHDSSPQALGLIGVAHTY